jgi:hypothetical protein
MFKITHNTAHRFSLTEILLMVAINQLEAKQKAARTSANKMTASARS